MANTERSSESRCPVPLFIMILQYLDMDTVVRELRFLYMYIYTRHVFNAPTLTALGFQQVTVIGDGK